MYKRRLSRIHSVEDFRQAAKRILPHMVFDFVDGGSGGEATVRENRAAIERVRLVPRGLNDVRERSQEVELFGHKYGSPVVIGPTGLLSAFWPDAAFHLARAAGKHNIPFIVSNSTNVSIEDVAKQGSGQKWFQLYLPTQRDFVVEWFKRLQGNGFEVLQLTVDSAAPGNRLRDLHHGFAMPFKWSLPKLWDVITHFEYAMRMAPHPVPRPLMTIDGQQKKIFKTYEEGVRMRLNPSVSWDDVKWLRDLWKGPFMLKGMTDSRQAPTALAAGIDGIVISNHGGRQLDGAIATIDVLPEFVAAVGSKMTVMIDSGFRSGTDIVKAMALGAKGVQMGRPPVFAVSTAGEAGGDRLLTILKNEIDNAMALCGVRSLSELNPEFVRRVG